MAWWSPEAVRGAGEQVLFTRSGAATTGSLAKGNRSSAGTSGLAAGFAACELTFWGCEQKGKKPENPSAVQVVPALSHGKGRAVASLSAGSDKRVFMQLERS